MINIYCLVNIFSTVVEQLCNISIANVQHLLKIYLLSNEKKYFLSSCITRKEYSNLTFQTSYDALKEINSFISQDILRCRGSRKSAIYVAGENLQVE